MAQQRSSYRRLTDFTEEKRCTGWCGVLLVRLCGWKILRHQTKCGSTTAWITIEPSPAEARTRSIGPESVTSCFVTSQVGRFWIWVVVRADFSTRLRVQRGNCAG